MVACLDRPYAWWLTGNQYESPLGAPNCSWQWRNSDLWPLEELPPFPNPATKAPDMFGRLTFSAEGSEGPISGPKDQNLEGYGAGLQQPFRLGRSLLKSRTDPQEARSEWNKVTEKSWILHFLKTNEQAATSQNVPMGLRVWQRFRSKFSQTKKKKKKIEGIPRGKLLYQGCK